MRARLAALAAVALTLALPASASAHATVESTSPARGATVRHEPAQVVLTFDEPVEGSFGAVRVFDARGARVDDGAAFHPAGDGRRFGVRLQPGLPHGAYTATFRVVSADGHVVSGGFTFSIGRTGGAPGETVGRLLANSGTGPVTSVAFSAVRAVQYAAIGGGGGALVFLLAVWLPALAGAGAAAPQRRAASAGLRRRLRIIVLAAATAGLVSALAGLVLEGADAAGVSFWSALRGSILSAVLETRFGTIWAAGAGAWLVVGALAAAALGRLGRGRAPVLVALAAPVGFLVALPALSGHGAIQPPVGVMLPANLLHVAAMTAWLGGLLVLLAALPAATRRLDALDRGRLLAGVLDRFSAIALAAVGVLLVTGVAQAYVEIRDPGLIFTTAFGRAAFIKVCLLALLVVLGAVNRQRTLPRLRAQAARGTPPGAAGIVLRRTLRGEVALLAVVLGTTGALAGYAPATAADTGPFSATTRIGPEQLQLTVDPARAGANQIHLHLRDPRTGAPFTRAKEVDVTAAEAERGIGPLDQHAHRAGPGRWMVPSSLLAVPGTWTLEVAVRVSAFDEYVAKVQVPLR